MRQFVATIVETGTTPDETNTYQCATAADVRALFSLDGCNEGNIAMTVCEIATLNAYLETIGDGSTTLHLSLALAFTGVEVTVTTA